MQRNELFKYSSLLNAQLLLKSPSYFITIYIPAAFNTYSAFYLQKIRLTYVET